MWRCWQSVPALFLNVPLYHAPGKRRTCQRSRHHLAATAIIFKLRESVVAFDTMSSLRAVVFVSALGCSGAVSEVRRS